MEQLLKYFPELSEKQIEQFTAIGVLYKEWNAKINVVSRKDIDNIYEHHILHSMAIAKIIKFREKTNVLDIGTGGGFPGIPLAILYPECSFHLIDSIGKKTKVAQAIADTIGLKNVKTSHLNVIEDHSTYDFIVSRAVMNMSSLYNLVKKNISKKDKNALPNGIICLKGGDLEEEMTPFKKRSEQWDISDFFKEDFFETKKIVYIPLTK